MPIERRQRKRPRPSYACIECTRRKLRCSKHIPCSACVDRGITQLCRRRTGDAVRERLPVERARPTSPALEQRESSSTTSCSEGQPEQISSAAHRPGLATSSPRPPSSAPSSVNFSQAAQPRQKIVHKVTEDAAVILEFLALSRQNVLQVAQIEQAQSPQRNNKVLETFDPVFPVKQVRAMMLYHQKCISWIHNVVHLPTFRDQCEQLFVNNAELQGGWLALYYAMLAVSLYHIEPSILRELDIESPAQFSEQCYQQSIDALQDADFMIHHSLSSVQAICLLIYVGHNIGQSDRISVLLSCGIRIAQCLCLHRLGPDPTVERKDQGETEQTIQRRLIDREVSKRVWWFLVRQDWLQIPFNNTYTIHPTQFNTPMPMNCDEEIAQMFKSNRILEHDQEHYTQGSYTTVLNHVAVLIWRTQDRMCQQGHPNQVEDGLRKLYAEVIQADHDLRDIMERMPSFFKMSSESNIELPMHIIYQREVLSLALAHKFHSIHRHFHIPSFKDPWFAYTKVSCLPIMRRSLATIVSSLEEPYFWIIRNMWTVNTHVLTAAIWLLFELIFSKDQGPLFDGREIKDLALKCARFLQLNQARSRIAKRGHSLINTLLETYDNIEQEHRAHFDLKHIMSRVERDEDCSGVDSSSLNFSQANDGSVVDWLSRDSATLENILDVLGNF